MSDGRLARQENYSSSGWNGRERHVRRHPAAGVASVLLRVEAGTLGAVELIQLAGGTELTSPYDGRVLQTHRNVADTACTDRN